MQYAHMQEWYYSNSISQFGPVSESELRTRLSNGELEPATTLVWKSGMQDWIPATQVPTLNPTAADTITDATPQTGETAAISTPSKVNIDAIASWKRGLDLTFRHFETIMVTVVLYFVLLFVGSILIPLLISIIMISSNDNEVLAVFGACAGLLGFHILSTWLYLGCIRVCLDLASGKPTGASRLFTEGRSIISATAAGILLSIAVSIGLLLFIIPGFYLIARYGFFIHAIVDRKCGPIEALSYSSEITRNNRIHVFLLLILSFLTAMLGIAAFFIGVFIAYPMILMGWAVAYYWLQYGNRAAMDHPGTRTPMLAMRP